MSVHQNSLAAYYDRRMPDAKHRRHKAIIEALRECGPMTDREIRDRLGFSEMNQVRPRITELLDMGALIEVESKKCVVTGRTVRQTAVNGNGHIVDVQA